MTWDERYRQGHYPSEPSPFVVDVVRALPPGRALDLACGAGRHAHWLAARGWSVIAIDDSAEALRRVRAPKLLLDLQRQPLPFAGAVFDLVLIIRFAHAPLFDEAERVLKPRGTIVVEVNTTGRFAMEATAVETRFASWERVAARAALGDAPAPSFAFAARKPPGEA